jgi:hypothetical protein
MPGAGRGNGNGNGRGAGGGTAGQAGAGADAGRGGRGGQNQKQPPAAARGPLPMVARGAGYDAILQWRPAGNEAAIKGYTILMRSTTAPLWEQEIYVGKVNTYTLKDVSVDDVRFGVKAVGNDGTESIVSSYVYPPRAKATYDATPIQ